MMKTATRCSIVWGIILAVGVTNILCPVRVIAQDMQTETVSAPAADAKPAVQPGPFAKGKVRVGFYGGAGSTYNQTYVILGGGVGYFLVNGLEVGADIESWLFKDPTIWKLTPQIRYVVWQMEPIRPYIGAFWRQTYVGDPFEDYSSYGARGGVAYRNGGNYLAAGVVYEKYNDCVSGDCDVIYPEIAFWLSF